jgi:diguanylate cyclase (GGDEF)-like protein/PAS domain S-box-containing protein
MPPEAKQPPERRRFGWPAVALCVFAAVALLRAGGFLAPFENAAADARATVLRHEVDSPIVIVGIDAQSLSELRAWPWPRRTHARLIEKLQQSAPRRVFFDIDFSSPSNPEDDALLAAAFAAWPREPIVLPVFFQYTSSADGDVVLTRPLEPFAQHATLASANLRRSEDGLVRSMSTSWHYGSAHFPTTIAAVSEPRTEAEREVPLDFSISPASFGYVSYADVLAGRVDPSVFTGKTVFIGNTSSELNDMFAVPVYHWQPGVVVQALGAETIRQGIPYSLPVWLLSVLAAALTTTLAALFCAWSWRRNLALLGGTLAAIGLASLYAYAAHRLTIEVVPLALATLGTFVVATVRSLDEQTLRAIAYAFGLRARDALLNSIVESSTDGIVCMKEDGHIQTANAAAARLFGCSDADALIGAPIQRFIPLLPLDQTGGTTHPFETLSSSLSEWEARTAAGDAFPVELSISRVRLNEERLYTAIVRDISQRRAHQRALEHQASHDSLTELPNRAALALHLDHALKWGDKSKPLALFMLDLCRFKEVNDTLGHNVGDNVLCEVARRFRGTIGEHGFIARIGGDEFTVVLSDIADVTIIEETARRLQQSLSAPIDVSGISIEVGLSIGVALYPLDALDADTLLKHADVAMYVSKRRSSSYECYDAAHDQHSVRRLTMVGELRNALESHRINLFYQPKVNLQTGFVDSAEALLRWQHPKFGSVSPMEFVTAAESTDVIVPLTEWTLRESLAQMVRWRQSGLAMSVAVNLSARMLQDAGFPARLRALFEQSEACPDWLEIEITESAMMVDPARALRVLKEINDLGVRIAVDDYGTGYSSLSYLRDLPISALKLDKSFVLNMQRRHDDRVIVESTIQMARALALHVVAEGVETEWDASFLMSLGCDYAQGFHYSRAVSAPECFEWVQRFNAEARSRHAVRQSAQARSEIGTGTRIAGTK